MVILFLDKLEVILYRAASSNGAIDHTIGIRECRVYPELKVGGNSLRIFHSSTSPGASTMRLNGVVIGIRLTYGNPSAIYYMLIFA